MSYYKYVVQDRVDVIETLKIRYTQVSALNDPFEALPAVRPEFTSDEYKRMCEDAIECAIVQDPPLSRKARREFKRETVKKLLRQHKAKTSNDSLTRFQNRIRNITESTTGILSLSRCCDNILMWSHYAGCHTGFVIEFDSCHPYFEYGTEDVVYSRSRPSMIARLGSHSADILRTKSIDWAYEQEVRRIENLHENVKQLPNGHRLIVAPNEDVHEDPTKIHLFDIPKDIVVGVILGWKSPPYLRCQVETALQRQRMDRVQLKYAEPSLVEYRMTIESMPRSKCPTSTSTS